MRPADRKVALAMREALVVDGPDPRVFRRALLEVPAIDRDAWLDAVWDVRELPEDDPGLPSGGVPYLPCPVDAVLEALSLANVTPEDVFVDVGAGLGRVVALAHLCTGARVVGLEFQPSLVSMARSRALALGLRELEFVEGDAVDTIAGATDGTVFFFYCPFGRSRMVRVLETLAPVARRRPVHVCCVGMARLDTPWLAEVESATPDLAVYRSR